MQQFLWWLKSAGLQVPSPARHSGLRIWGCHSCDIGHNCSSDLIPGPGNSICQGVAKKKDIRNKNLKKFKLSLSRFDKDEKLFPCFVACISGSPYLKESGFAFFLKWANYLLINFVYAFSKVGKREEVGHDSAELFEVKHAIRSMLMEIRTQEKSWTAGSYYQKPGG